MTEATHPGTVLIYSIHNSEPWWRCVGEAMGFERAVLVSDLRGEGDHNLVDDFYAAYHRLYAARATESPLLSAAEIDDVIARCRLLRWLPRRKAAAMTLAMAEACEIVLTAVNPRAVVSWPIDRYVSDVLERRAKAHGIPYFEVTASAIAGMSMLLYRGRLITGDGEPDPAEVDARVREIADPLFTPAYVQRQKRYTAWRWIKTFSYFKLRGLAFWLISLAKRDPLNLHYLDAQSFLGHKPRLPDIRILGLVEQDWAAKIAPFPKGKRLFMALQLFPEASIDYWIDELALIEHEDMLVETAAAFSAAGYCILVKDHPLQFGFRQCGLIDRLKSFPNVVIVPYEVSGNALLAECGVTFTCTGTLGMQAALLGLKAITTETYFTTPDDFIFLRHRSEVAGLPARVTETPEVTDLPARQRRIIAHLLKGSFTGEFMSFKGFDASNPDPSVAVLGRALGSEVAHHDCDWHKRNPWPPGPAGAAQ